MEEIRKNVASLEGKKWSIHLSWIKSHAVTRGNEIADRLAKEAARSGGTEYEFARIPKSTIYQEARELARQKMAKRVGNKPKSCSNQAIFSYTSRQTKNQDKSHPKNNSGTDWARDDEGFLAPVPPE